jgi:hypothetical protein
MLADARWPQRAGDGDFSLLHSPLHFLSCGKKHQPTFALFPSSPLHVSMGLGVESSVTEVMIVMIEVIISSNRKPRSDFAHRVFSRASKGSAQR